MEMGGWWRGGSRCRLIREDDTALGGFNGKGGVAAGSPDGEFPPGSRGASAVADDKVGL